MTKAELLAGHTPLPWERQSTDCEGPDYGVSIIGSNLGGLVAAALPWSTEIEDGDFSRVEANAEFIVRACNSHYDLLEALQALVNSFEKHRPKKYWDDARAAIAKATGRPYAHKQKG